MEQEKIDYMLAPLASMDVKSLALVAERLKKSLNKADKAVGSFLLRYADYRGGESRSGLQSSQPASQNLAQLRNLK